MKINNVSLYNFGSYSGVVTFDTEERAGKNIVLIGGKNGAGKTTLFTAMRLCLYGYMSMGYKNINSYYIRAITKLINNSAKLERPCSAYVSLDIALSNGHEMDQYTIKRSWSLEDTVVEHFNIIKNGETLSGESVADFEKYILSLIPPELFNLYFFDGEKIADFFMEEGSNSRVKNAFLTLCGYDTFDIMRKNFRRISAGLEDTPLVLKEYVSLKEQYECEKEAYDISLKELNECVEKIDCCDADILALEKNYSKNGGVTQDIWNKKKDELICEEKKREHLNLQIRQWANEKIPFIMIKDVVKRVKKQVEEENNCMKYKNFIEIMNSSPIREIVGDKVDEIEKIAFSRFGGDTNSILNLSLIQSGALLSQINEILQFDVNSISEAKSLIKQSIAYSKKIRNELENSSVVSVQEYMEKKAELHEMKSELCIQRVEQEHALTAKKDSVDKTQNLLMHSQKQLENEIKKSSIKNISVNAILMLDKLQDILYEKQIKKAEELFRKIIPMLMRKVHFIDDIKIDSEFNIHLYRNENFLAKKLFGILSSESQENIIAFIGRRGLDELARLAKSENLSVVDFCKNIKQEYISLPIEIDKTTLSNGEKQIFIMAFYYSLVQLGKHEIPFIIDTPFARIDTEHRHNISKFFFSKLKGQVFILSTNEEINASHVNLMRNKISATYMLDNIDNKCTNVYKDTYFEV